ncbi:MAG: tetraacyldisaccharide 4'-kinase [Rhodocyclales bacterium]|nr:tetraacyldisaccharide 4'-kinase [Rhodocyclales bacterium]
MFARWLQRQWFEQRRLTPALWLLLPFLLPLNLLFITLAALKRRTTQAVRLDVPVVVVGNITVGGAGKTPLTIALARALRQRGWQPGIVSRGYGSAATQVRPVTPQSSAAEVGDEPLLLQRHSGVPVWVGRDRAAAALALRQQHPQVDLILCDDGLQHYRLGRDVELAVFDGRGAGNAWRLPLGPLREPLARLNEVDAIVCNGEVDARLLRSTPISGMKLLPGEFYRLGDPAQTCTADALRGKTLHALAGIGDPQRFFRTLASLGLESVNHPFPDHHAYTQEDLCFAKDGILLMTEKDAVKCSALSLGETWVLPVEAELAPALIDLVLEKLRGRQIA